MKPLSRVIVRNTALRSAAGFLALALAFGFLSAAGAAGPGASGNKFYCCNDSTGKQVCGDILPQGCFGRAYRELGTDGRTLREVEAPLTAEQRIQRMAEEAKRKEEEARQKEQQRKDQALMDTYATVDDIESMRKRSLEEINKSIKNAEARIAEIRTLRKKYENEAEFYKKKKMPAEVQKGLSDTEFEIKGQEAIIESKNKESDAAQAKYDDDRKRLIDLMRRKGVLK